MREIERERGGGGGERERECVCVCVRERERERERDGSHVTAIAPYGIENRVFAPFFAHMHTHHIQ